MNQAVAKKIPALRFSEFKEEWEEKKLGDVCRIQTGDKDTQDRQKDGEYPFFVRSNTIERINSYSFDGEAILTSGDGVGVGKNFHYINGRFDFHQRVYCLNTFRKEYSGKFIFCVFSTKFYDRVKHLSAKNSVDSVRMEMISGMKIAFPSILEQQKIASFLSSIDEWLENLRGQKKNLEKYKKSMIQKVFSQEIRFKDENGKNFPEWKEKRLGDCLSYEQPTDYIVKSTEYDAKFKTPVLTAGKSFILGYTNEAGGVCGNLPVIIFDDFTTSSRFVNFPFKVKSSAVKMLRSKIGFNTKFIFEALQQIKYEVGGHGRHWISVFSNLSLLTPSYEEQTRIAEFISTLDELVDIKQNQITQAEEWKKGLMQQMFI